MDCCNVLMSLPEIFATLAKKQIANGKKATTISVLEFKTTEYGREKKVVSDTSTADEIRKIGIRQTMNLTKMSQHTIEKLVRREAVRRGTRDHVLKAIQVYKSKMETPQISSRPMLLKPITDRARPDSENQNSTTSIVKKAA